jgi:hypothetical protein
MHAVGIIEEFVSVILSPPRLPFRHSGVKIILGYLAAHGNPGALVALGPPISRWVLSAAASREGSDTRQPFPPRPLSEDAIGCVDQTAPRANQPSKTNHQTWVAHPRFAWWMSKCAISARISAQNCRFRVYFRPIKHITFTTDERLGQRPALPKIHDNY